MKYRNGILSAVFGIVQQLLTLIFGLIVPRLFIKTMGSEVNGLLGSLSNVYSYLALVEAGVGTVAIQALYGTVGRKDNLGTSQIMSAVGKYYNKAGFIYLLGVIAISVIYPLTVATTVPKMTVFLLAVLNGMGGVINFWVHGKYMVLLQAEGKKYLMSIVTMVVYVVQNVTKIVLLNLGFDVILIHVGYFVISLCQMSFYFLYIKRNYKWLDMKAEPNRKALEQSSAVFVQQITSMICGNTDILVLTYVAMDLKAVSVYNVYFMIYTAIERLFANVFGSFHYLLGQKYNVDKEHYMPIHDRYESISMAGAFALYTITYVLTAPFIRIYTNGIHDAAYVDQFLPLLFTLPHLMASSREACARVINFAGHFRQMQWRGIVEGIINIVCSILLVPKLGIHGVLIGTVIALFYRTNDAIIYANKKVLGRSIWHTYRKYVLYLAVFAVLGLIACFVNLNPSNLVLFFLMAVPCGLVVCLAYIFALLIVDRDSVRVVVQFVWESAAKFLKKQPGQG